MLSETLTKQQAYAAMYAFLEEVYRRTESDDLGALLGGMMLLEDGGTADPSVWNEWEKAVKRVQAGSVDLAMRFR